MTEFVDNFGRSIRYVRLSVTDQCNLRCFYCMPKGFNDFREPEQWLNFDEIEQLMRAFVALGVTHIRLTGGEPLVRRNLAQLVARLNTLKGLEDLSLSTNAVLLDKHAQILRQAGVNRINVSLDTLDAQRFTKLCGGKIDKVFQGLLAAKNAGFDSIKLNTVALAGINDDEFDAMLQFCAENGFIWRLIEPMPMGTSGLLAAKKPYDLTLFEQQLKQRYTVSPATILGKGPARYFYLKELNVTVGLITPLSQPFCSTCNRVRVSVDGTLYLCLGQNTAIPLRELLRQGVSHTELVATLQHTLLKKPERHEFIEKPEQVIRIMSMTGG